MKILSKSSDVKIPSMTFFISQLKRISLQQKPLKVLNSDLAYRHRFDGGIDALSTPTSSPQPPSSWPPRHPSTSSDRLVSPTVSCHFQPVRLHHPSATVPWPSSWRRERRLRCLCFLWPMVDVFVADFGKGVFIFWKQWNNCAIQSVIGLSLALIE